MPLSFRSDGPPPPTRFATPASAETVCVASFRSAMRAALAAAPTDGYPGLSEDHRIHSFAVGDDVAVAALAAHVDFLLTHRAAVAGLAVAVRRRGVTLGALPDDVPDDDIEQGVVHFGERMRGWLDDVAAAGTGVVTVEAGAGSIAEPCLVLLR